MRKCSLLAGSAVLAALGVWSAVASAAAPNTVKLSVPSLVQTMHLKVKASGASKNSSHLTVFITGKACASSSAAEAKLVSREIINKSVVHSYSASKKAAAGPAGYHNVCAYLTSANGSTLAHGTATYAVLIGAY